MPGTNGPSVIEHRGDGRHLDSVWSRVQVGEQEAWTVAGRESGRHGGCLQRTLAFVVCFQMSCVGVDDAVAKINSSSEQRALLDCSGPRQRHVAPTDNRVTGQCGVAVSPPRLAGMQWLEVERWPVCESHSQPSGQHPWLIEKLASLAEPAVHLLEADYIGVK